MCSSLECTSLSFLVFRNITDIRCRLWPIYMFHKVLNEMKVKYTFCSVLMWISDLECSTLHWLIIGTSVVSRNYRTDKLNYWLLKQQSWLGELTGRLLVQFSNYLLIISSSLFVLIFYCQSSLQSPSPQCNTIIRTNQSKMFGGIWTNQSASL